MEAVIIKAWEKALGDDILFYYTVT